jgi:hypothetical protein
MNQNRDIDWFLDAWLTDGPTVAPDRVLDVVADRIERQGQRPAWRLDWRLLSMNPLAKVGAAIAAVVLVAFIGYNLLPRTSGVVGGPSPTATPTVSPTPTATATVALTALSMGPLPAGTYWTGPFGSASAIKVTFALPAGWEGFPDWAVIGPRTTDAPDGIGVAFLMASAMYSDPCHWDVAGTGAFPQPGDIAVGPTVDDLVAALRANTAYTASAPVDVVVDGHAGKQLDLQLPADVDFTTTCDKPAGSDSGAYLVWSPPSGTENDLYAQGPGTRWQLRIVDVDGARIIILIDDYAGTPEADRAAAKAIVDSIQFLP